MPITPAESGEEFLGPGDKIFCCVAKTESEDGAKLVTSNQRHYPPVAFVVTPGESCSLIGI